MDFSDRKTELLKESEELQKQITGLDRQRTQLIQKALEIKGAYDEIVRIENKEKEAK